MRFWESKCVSLPKRRGRELSEEKEYGNYGELMYLGGKVAAGFLAFALLPDLDYGFYQLLRWVVFVVAVVWAVYGFKYNRNFTMLVGLVALILWNPLAPIYLDREVWVPLDIVFALVFWFGDDTTPERDKNLPDIRKNWK